MDLFYITNVTVTNSSEMQVGLLTRIMISKFALVSKDA